MEREWGNYDLYYKCVELSENFEYARGKKRSLKKRLIRAFSAASDSMMTDLYLNEKAKALKDRLAKIKKQISTTKRVMWEVNRRLAEKFTSLGGSPECIKVVPGRIAFYGIRVNSSRIDRPFSFTGSYSIADDKWSSHSGSESLSEISKIAHSVFEGIVMV